MPSKTFATSDVLTASDMNLLTLAPQTADVIAEQATTSSSYTDLSTAGPSVTLSLVNGQHVLVLLSAYGFSNGSGNVFFAGFQVTGASGTIAASDANAIRWREGTTGGSLYVMAFRPIVFTASGTGSTTFTMKYKSDGTNTCTWGNRRIICFPKF